MTSCLPKSGQSHFRPFLSSKPRHLPKITFAELRKSPSRLILPLVKAGSRRTIRPVGKACCYAAFAASVTASAPAGMRRAEEASVTACQTASATSLAVVTSTGCCGAAENTCLAQAA